MCQKDHEPCRLFFGFGENHQEMVSNYKLVRLASPPPPSHLPFPLPPPNRETSQKLWWKKLVILLRGSSCRVAPKICFFTLAKKLVFIKQNLTKKSLSYKLNYLKIIKFFANLSAKVFFKPNAGFSLKEKRLQNCEIALIFFENAKKYFHF